MPALAADRSQIPFCNAKEEIHAGLERSACGGGPEQLGTRGKRQSNLWWNVILMSLLHLGAAYSLMLLPKAKPLTLL